MQQNAQAKQEMAPTVANKSEGGVARSSKASLSTGYWARRPDEDSDNKAPLG